LCYHHYSSLKMASWLRQAPTSGYTPDAAAQREEAVPERIWSFWNHFWNIYV
jgi:hypothetical protein